MEDATVITDQKDKIRQQECYYERLYTSQKAQPRADHFPPSSIKVIQGRPKDKDTCKGNISDKKCLDTLKVMGDGKSPRMDGFTAES